MRIITINLWGRSGPWPSRYALAAAQLAALRPDVLCLQEIDDESCLRTLVRATGLEIAVADLTVSTLAILARGTHATELVELNARSPFEPRPRRMCAVHIDGVTVANTHLSWRPQDAATRRAQAEQICAHLATPAILCGDLNCERTAPELASLAARFADACAGHPAALHPTWDNRNPHTAPYRDTCPDTRLDHILADPTLLAVRPVREAAVVLDTPNAEGLYPSDHFGVLVELTA